MNVLIAMDGSKYSRWSLNWIAALPWADTPTVTALHVTDVGALRAPLLVQPVIAGNERFIREEIKRMERRADATLAEARQGMRTLRLSGKVKKEQGSVAKVILREAPKRNGLIVVGSQGHDAVDRFMLGSVSNKVIHHASCPVLVVKGLPARPLRIALAVDGSAASRTALNYLRTHFRPTDSPVTVIHVMPFLKYPELKAAGSRMVEDCAKALARSGFSTQVSCRIGNPADEIMKAASRANIGLIVTGAKGLGAIGRFFLGSVSTRIVQHSHCSVLIAR